MQLKLRHSSETQKFCKEREEEEGGGEGGAEVGFLLSLI